MTLSDRIILTMTHHPHNLAALKILKRNLPILHSDLTARIGFPETPQVALKSDWNLWDILVRGRIINSRSAQAGTSLCGRGRCRTCPFVFSSDTIHFPVFRNG
jgi:hypothetical protein